MSLFFLVMGIFLLGIGCYFFIKKQFNIYIRLLIVILGLSFIFLSIYKYVSDKKVLEKYPASIKLNKDTFEYYDKVYINDILDVKNAEVITKNKKIDTLKLGKQLIEIRYRDKANNINSIGLNINVVDTTPPKIYHSSSYTIKKGNDFNYMSKIICGDNYDPNIECLIEGDYDVNTAGTYNLNFVSTDINGNKTVSPFKLYVKDKLTSSSGGGGSYTPRTKPIEEFIANYKNDKNLIGIDVSSWQGDVDYEKVKSSGVSFVIVRVGFANSDGICKIDSKFKQNLENAKKAGLKVGAYFYSKAKSVEMAKEHAKWVIEQLGGVKLDLPISFDWECWSNFNEYHISYVGLNLIAQSFMNEVEKHGYVGMNYGSASYLEKMWDTSASLIWMAHYTKKTDYEKEYYIWQVTDSGIVPGIDAYVDLNVLYLSEDGKL